MNIEMVSAVSVAPPSMIEGAGSSFGLPSVSAIVKESPVPAFEMTYSTPVWEAPRSLASIPASPVHSPFSPQFDHSPLFEPASIPVTEGPADQIDVLNSVVIFDAQSIQSTNEIPQENPVFETVLALDLSQAQKTLDALTAADIEIGLAESAVSQALENHYPASQTEITRLVQTGLAVSLTNAQETVMALETVPESVEEEEEPKKVAAQEPPLIFVRDEAADTKRVDEALNTYEVLDSPKNRTQDSAVTGKDIARAMPQIPRPSLKSRILDSHDVHDGSYSTVITGLIGTGFLYSRAHIYRTIRGLTEKFPAVKLGHHDESRVDAEDVARVLTPLPVSI